MYGTIFTQRYGWYVSQTYLRFGIFPPVGDKVEMMLYGIEFLPEHISYKISRRYY